MTTMKAVLMSVAMMAMVGAAGAQTNGSPAPTPPAGAVPADCTLYASEVHACVKQMGPGNTTGATMKQQIDAFEKAWPYYPDKVKLAALCKQEATGFAQNAHALGCKL